MLVLHISTYDSGGAGLGMLNLHKGLLKAGIDSRVLVLNKKSDLESVYSYPIKNSARVLFFKKILMFLRIYKRDYYQVNKILWKKLGNNREFYYTVPYSLYDVHKHPLIQQADVIHLHWVAGYIDYPTFFKYVQKKIIWTIRDYNFFCGGFHHAKEFRNHYTSLKCIEDKLAFLKKEIISGIRDLTIVCMNKSHYDYSKLSEMGKRRNHFLIPNLIDSDLFTIQATTSVRPFFQLPTDKIIFLFVSIYLNDRNKGFGEMVKALEILYKDVDFCVAAVGHVDEKPQTDMDIHYLGSIKDPTMMAKIFSCANYFIIPSFEEAFSKTTIEALSCGIPVVSFPNNNSLDIINTHNGVIASDFTVEALVEAIKKALKLKFNKIEIRKDAIARFSIDKVTEEYIRVYRNL